LVLDNPKPLYFIANFFVMKTFSVPASAYASQYLSAIRPELDWQKMKDNLGQLLAKYNELVELDKLVNPKSTLKKMAVSMENTAKNILWIFMKKFSAGQVRHRRVKFTYSYLASSVGKDFRAPAVITVTRHIQRILSMPYTFIKEKRRSTLGIKGCDLNCIELEIDPRVIVFKNPKVQEAHERGLELVIQPKVKELKKVPVMPLNAPKTMLIHTTPVSKPNQQSSGSIGDVMGQILLNLQPKS
jgi:hypothetical protein